MPLMIPIPLDLPDVKVLSTEVTPEGEIIITVESTQKGTKCRRCGCHIEQFHGYDEPLRLRHLPVFERQVSIEIRPRRYRCSHCKGGPTTTQRCRWYDPRSPHTKAFEQSLLRALINSTVVDVSRKLGLTEEVVEGALERQVASQVDWNRFDHLGVLGIDEIALRKGHRDFVTIVSRRSREGEITVLAVLPDRCKETVVAFLGCIPEPLKATVEQVCCDMYDGFLNAVKETLPQAKTVVDRFHVAKAYRGCADALRRQEVKRLKGQLSEPDYEAQVKGTLWLFRKPWSGLTPGEQQRLQGLFNLSPPLGAVHLMREIMTAIFEQATSKDQAQAWMQMWREYVVAHDIKGFDSFFITLDNHQDAITNYFLDRNSSGFVEGLNNKIKVLKRRCYGLLDVKGLFRRLTLDLEGYRLFGYA